MVCRTSLDEKTKNLFEYSLLFTERLKFYFESDFRSIVKFVKICILGVFIFGV